MFGSPVHHFHLEGFSKNCVFWGTEPPQEVLQRPLHSSKVTAWCAISSKAIIGPYWFEDGDGRTVTVNQENYRTIVRKFYASVTRRRGIDINRQWFMQDGATPHTANATLEPMAQKFGDRVISRRTDNPWAAHSPDLNPCDFFLWGYAKDNIYAGNPTTLQDLKIAITRFVRQIPADICKRVTENFARAYFGPDTMLTNKLSKNKIILLLYIYSMYTNLVLHSCRP